METLREQTEVASEDLNELLTVMALLLLFESGNVIQRLQREVTDVLNSNDSKSVKLSRINQIVANAEKQLNTALANGLKDGINKGVLLGSSNYENILKSLGSSTTLTNKAKESLAEAVYKRIGEDGLKLSDRVWSFSNATRQEVYRILREGVLSNKPVNVIMSDISKLSGAQEWQIKRLVNTEISYAYRSASHELAKLSKKVVAMRLIRGRANNPRHNCTILSKRDSYGLGVGIYPIPVPQEALFPHPNCTSVLLPLLNDEIGGDE